MVNSSKLQRDVVMSTLALGAIVETGWTIFLAVRLPRHYVANHWDLAWVGLDSAQVIVLLLTGWAAWRRRAILILFANAAATLLFVDAWFDVTTARYRDLTESLLSLTIEIPSALFLLWMSRRTAKRVTRAWLSDSDLALVPTHRLKIPHS